MKQKIPLYMNIQKGDGVSGVVVADGDGIIVVPRERAPEVAEAAREELRLDKAARKRLYQQLGIPMDKTVTD